MKDEKDEEIEKVWKKVWNSNFVYKINDPWHSGQDRDYVV